MEFPSTAEQDLLLVESLLGGSLDDAPTILRFDVSSSSDEEMETAEVISSSVKKDIALVDSLLGGLELNGNNKHAFRFDTALLDSDSEDEAESQKSVGETLTATIGRTTDETVFNEKLSTLADNTVKLEDEQEDNSGSCFGLPAEYHTALIEENRLIISDKNGHATLTITKDMLSQWEEDLKTYMESEEADLFK